MRLTDSTLDQVKAAIENVYKTRQFGAGGESSKVTINSYLEDCRRIEDSNPDAEFRYTADIFEPARAQQVVIQMYAKGQAQYILTTVRADYAWSVSPRVVPEPITVLATPDEMPGNNG